MWLLDSDIWREVYNTLTKNLVRTVLTTLGVLFAVIILILLLGAANGMKNGFEKIFTGTAVNSTFIWSRRTAKPYKGFKRGREIRFSTKDITLIKDNINHIENIVPRINLKEHRTVRVHHNGKTGNPDVFGDYPAIDNITKKNLIIGRFINQDDINKRRKVCNISQATYKNLFKPNEVAIGKYIVINNLNFKVVGIHKKKKGVNIDGVNLIIIPFTSFQKSFNTSNKIDYMAISIKATKKVSPILRQIKNLLKKKHNINPDDNRAIGSFDTSEMFQNINAFTSVLQGFSFFIGIFTLLAGVIAISNILLITVKERTKEIGIRRALGATPKDIKRQIILEALVLTTISALVGFVISIGVLYLIDTNINTNDIPFINPTVSFIQLISSFVLMIGLSILIGLIPANRAIKIKPIEALRDS